MKENKTQTGERLHNLLKIGRCRNGAPEPLLIDLYVMCKTNEAENYYQQIRNRILSEAEEMPEADNEIRFKKNDHNRIMLTDTGIFLVSHILNGYMDQDIVISYWRNLRDLNRLRLDQYNLEHIFDPLTREQLGRLIVNIKKVVTTTDLQEPARLTLTCAKREYRKKCRSSIFGH